MRPPPHAYLITRTIASSPPPQSFSGVREAGYTNSSLCSRGQIPSSGRLKRLPEAFDDQGRAQPGFPPVLQVELDQLDLPDTLVARLVRELPPEEPRALLSLERIPSVHYLALVRLDSLTLLSMLSQVGLILFMFLVGLEFDGRMLRGRGHTSVVISHTSIILPFGLGALIALYLYPRLSPPSVPFKARP